MGADLCMYILTWDKDSSSKLNWDAGFKAIQDIDEKIIEECSLEKIEYITNLQYLKDSIEDGNSDTACITVGHLNIMATGGMSWGESPTETFNAIANLDILNGDEFDYLDILEIIGFNHSNCPDYKKLLLMVLEQKDILPVLLGRDDFLDKLITERLKT